MIEIGTLMDFVGSLSILGMLAVGYGSIRRALPGTWMAESLLGLLFGAVAVMQMSFPFEPMPGLIVDMRNVPVVLAGAFLGARGLCLCVILAISARLQIGGIGAPAGVAAILIAGAGGTIWDAATARRNRGPLAMICLVLILSVHFVSVVLLPFEVAVWFMMSAAPVLVALYFLSVPIVASLLERERRMMTQEAELRRAANIGAGIGLMPRDALAWAMIQASVTGSLRDGASVIAVDLRHRGALARLWGTEADKIATATLSDRLEAMLPDGGIVGWVASDRAMMVIPKMSETCTEETLMRLQREVAGDPIPVPGMAAIRLSLDLTLKTYDSLPPLADVLSDVSMETVDFVPPEPKREHRRKKSKRSVRNGNLPRTSAVDQCRDDLFGTFDRLREARFGQV